jgi:hypothetical protein
MAVSQPAISAGVAHLVERHLAKVEVASSSLVARSSLFNKHYVEQCLLYGSNMRKRRHSQVVRQRTANPRLSSSNLDGASMEARNPLRTKGLRAFLYS